MLLDPRDVNFIASCLVTSVPDQWVHQLDGKRSGAEGTLVLIAAIISTGLSQAWHAQSVFQQLVLLWLTMELAFLVFQRWRYQVINTIVPAKRVSPARLHELQQRFLSLKDVFGLREFMEGWFCGAPLEQIQRGNVEELTAYAFWGLPVEKLTPQDHARNRQLVSDIEAGWNFRFLEGRNPSLRFMAHCWEPLQVIPKPLAVHLGSEAAGLGAQLLLHCMGLSRHRCQGITYWIREPARGEGEVATPAGLRNVHLHGSYTSLMPACGGSGAPAAKRPIVFLHGVGCGLVPYILFIRGIMAAYPGHPIVLMEVRHVSLRLCLRAAEVDDIAHAAHALLRRHGYANACFVAHSFGTFCVSRICQLHREIVQSMVLIDPVCLLTCFPQLLHSFVYKVPTWSSLRSPLGVLDAVRFVVARDLIVAETFCRKFTWHSLMLWPHDMPHDALIVLSANDDLVPCELVKVQLAAARSPARVMYHPTAGHGGFLIDWQWQKAVIENMEAVLAALHASEQLKA